MDYICHDHILLGKITMASDGEALTGLWYDDQAHFGSTLDPEYEKKRKRIVYNKLKDHDYSKQGPTMREIVPGHFVYCNDEEAERYKKECQAAIRQALRNHHLDSYIPKLLSTKYPSS